MLNLGFGSFIAAYFKWKYIDQPFRTNHQIISTKKLFLSGIFIIIGFFTFGMAAIATDRFSGRYSKQQLTHYQVVMSHEFTWDDCNFDKCESNHTDKAKIMFFGASLAPSFSTTFSTPFTKFAHSTMAGGPPLMDFYVSNTKSAECSIAHHSISQILIHS